MDTQKLNDILENFSNLEEKLNNLNSNDFSDYAKLSKEYSDLKPLIDKINQISTQNIQPNLTFCLDCDIQTIMRVGQDGQVNEQFI